MTEPRASQYASVDLVDESDGTAEVKATMTAVAFDGVVKAMQRMSEASRLLGHTLLVKLVVKLESDGCKCNILACRGC